MDLGSDNFRNELENKCASEREIIKGYTTTEEKSYGSQGTTSASSSTSSIAVVIGAKVITL